jgi:hypothetical protein
MINGNLKVKMLLAALCCFVLVLVIPVPSSAQLGGVVQGTKHGIQKGVDKTKEGAEAVGRGTKEVITGEDQNKDQEQNQDQNQNKARMKPGETQPATSSTETETQKSTTTTETEQKEPKRMPKTAGELPLLALAGCLSLAVAGAYRLADRSRRSHT